MARRPSTRFVLPDELARAAESRPAVPSSPAAIAGNGASEMGFFGALGGIISAGIGIAEGVTGIDVPGIGPGDKFFGGGGPSLPPAVPGGSGRLDVAGLPSLGLAPNGDCGFFQERNPFTGKCGPKFLGTGPGRDLPGGTSVLHPLGHADTVPVLMARQVRTCGRGAVLGIDGYCHPKRMIRNSDRMYPKPRRPLGTSGDLNAVTKAASFARRLKSNNKRLKKAATSLTP